MINNVMGRFPEDSYNSASTQLGYIAEGLAENGHQVDILLGKGKENKETHENIKLFEYENKFKTLGDTIYSHFHPSMNDFFHNKIIEVLSNDYDIIHVHDTLTFRNLKCVKDLNVPVIYTMHVPYHGYFPDVIENTDNNFIAAVSDYLIDEKISEQADIKEVIYNGIDLDDFEFKSEKDDYYLFNGRISDHKGFSYLLDVLDLEDINLKIVGPKTYEEEIENNIEGEKKYDRILDYDLDAYFERENVEYLGELSHSEIPELTANAKGLIHIHDWEEPFSLVIVEALASGTPVLSTDKGGPGEYLTDGYDSIILKNDDHYEAEKVLEGIKNLEEIDPGNCRKTAEQFDRKDLGLKYEELYLKAIEEFNN